MMARKAPIEIGDLEWLGFTDPEPMPVAPVVLALPPDVERVLTLLRAAGLDDVNTYELDGTSQIGLEDTLRRVAEGCIGDLWFSFTRIEHMNVESADTIWLYRTYRLESGPLQIGGLVGDVNSPDDRFLSALAVCKAAWSTPIAESIARLEADLAKARAIQARLPKETL